MYLRGIKKYILGRVVLLIACLTSSSKCISRKRATNTIMTIGWFSQAIQTATGNENTV